MVKLVNKEAQESSKYLRFGFLTKGEKYKTTKQKSREGVTKQTVEKYRTTGTIRDFPYITSISFLGTSPSVDLYMYRYRPLLMGHKIIRFLSS